VRISIHSYRTILHRVAYRTVSKAIPKPVIVKGSIVKVRTIVPNCDIVRILPPKPDLSIVVVHQQLLEPLEHICTFFLGQAVDMADVSADREDALPACDWIRTDDLIA
jgi:hypothetical protein